MEPVCRLGFGNGPAHGGGGRWNPGAQPRSHLSCPPQQRERGPRGRILRDVEGLVRRQLRKVYARSGQAGRTEWDRRPERWRARPHSLRERQTRAFSYGVAFPKRFGVYPSPDHAQAAAVPEANAMAGWFPKIRAGTGGLFKGRSQPGETKSAPSVFRSCATRDGACRPPSSKEATGRHLCAPPGLRVPHKISRACQPWPSVHS